MAVIIRPHALSRALKRRPFCAIFSRLITKPRRQCVGAEESVPRRKPSHQPAPALCALGLCLWGAATHADNACQIPLPVLPSTPADAPLQLEADAATYQPDSGKTKFTGKAQLSQPGRLLQAQSMTYQSASDTLEAQGEVRLTQPDLILSGSQATYHPQKGEGEVRDASFALPGSAARGEAAKVDLAADGKLTLQQPAYTTCPPDARSWALKADQIVLDRSSGQGTASGAHLQLGDVALPRLPEFSFPIDNRRKSGLLIPSIGYGSDNGVDVTLPYYFNLAPNYDLTLAPRLMSKRGALLGSEFRYLTAERHGELQAEILPDDRVYAGDSTRGGLTWRHAGRPFSGWRSRVDASYLSDAEYLHDLGNGLSSSATQHLQRVAELSRLGPHSAVLLRVQDFQVLDTALMVDRPYARLPQLQASLDQPLGEHAQLQLDSEYVHFDRDAGVTGQRVDLQPALAMHWSRPWGYVAPRLGVRYTGYLLDRVAPGADDSPDRFTRSVSLDSGLFFDRPLNLGGHAMVQTLEPRLFYLYVPRQGQSTLPIFDTDYYDFRFDSLFREDRFVGPDRVGDTNQLTLALSSRLRDAATGMERLHLGIGQILYFDDRHVVLPGETAQDNSRSALVAGMSALLDSRWRLDSALQWDPDAPDDGQVTRGFARLGWDDHKGHHLQAGYRLRRGETEQTDLAGSWRLNPRTRLVGRWRYSLDRDRSLETLAGVEYGSCCWKVRAVLQRHLDDVTNDANLGILLQLELSGLGRLGSNIDDLMSGGLAGYRPRTL
jgi:LPS-assembly protein